MAPVYTGSVMAEPVLGGDVLQNLIDGAKKISQEMSAPEHGEHVSQSQAALNAAELVVQEMMAKVNAWMAQMPQPARTEKAKNEKVLLNPADQRLKEATDNGAVDAASCLGKQFMREAKPGSKMRQEYDLLNQHEKAQFRLEWVEKKLEQAMKKYEKITTEEHSEITKARYCPFKVLWDNEGGDEAGYEAAPL